MQNNKYKELHDLFALAEKKIKQVEQINHEGLSIPSVNQLRYAGQHCLDSLVIDDYKEIENNIYEAKDHCKRAIYDAMEIGIVTILEKIQIFNKDYKYITITDVLPDYINTLGRIREIQSYIGKTSRRDIENNYEEIQDIDNSYKEIQLLFDEVVQIEKVLESARPELNKKINNWRRGLILALISISIALIGILVALLK